MKCIIIGCGYFGSIIKSKLSGHEIICVDPFKETSDFKSVDDVPYTDGYWFITTPANTHYEIILALFEKGVKNIWVEKPLCSTFDMTLDVFSKIPDDVFLYCDFTWLQHSAVKRIGQCENKKHIELKWLNDGSIAPTDVNIVLDLMIHPLSIVIFFLIKSRDIIDTIHVKYASKDSILVSGISQHGITFNIEVSNTSATKSRSIGLYCKDNVFRWYSSNEFHIENIGSIDKTDAIELNIDRFFKKCSIGYILDILRNLEIVNKQFCDIIH